MSSGALRTSPNMTSDDVLESLDSNNSLSLFDSSDSLLIREMLSSRALNGATFGLHSTRSSHRWLLVDAF